MTEVAKLKKEIEKKLDDYRNRFKAGGIEAEPHIGAGGMK